MALARRFAGVALAFLVLVSFAGPAGAQYGGGGGGGGGAPNQTLTVSKAVVSPGQTVTVTVGAGSCAPGTTITFFMVRLVPGATATTLGSTSAASDGSGTMNVTIPNVPNGNYVIYSQCPGPSGGTTFLTVAVVVTGSTVAAAAAPPVALGAHLAQSGQPAALPSAQPAVAPPAVVQQMQRQAAAGKVFTPGAAGPSRLATTGGNTPERAAVAGAVILLVGAGLLRLRRPSRREAS